MQGNFLPEFSLKGFLYGFLKSVPDGSDALLDISLFFFGEAFMGPVCLHAAWISFRLPCSFAVCVCFKPRWIGCEWGDKNREKHIPVDQTSCAQAFEYHISLSEIAFILSLDRLFPLELSNSTNSKSNYFGKDMWEEFCNMYSRSTFNAFEDFTVHCIPGKWELTGSRCN